MVHEGAVWLMQGAGIPYSQNLMSILLHVGIVPSEGVTMLGDACRNPSYA
jgi:hypothetical protein